MRIEEGDVCVTVTVLVILMVAIIIDSKAIIIDSKAIITDSKAIIIDSNFCPSVWCHLAHCPVQTHLLYIVTLIQLCMVQPHGYRCNRYGDNEYLCCILVSLELLALYTVYNNRMFHSKHTNQQQNPQTAPYSHNYSNTLIQVKHTCTQHACMHAHSHTHAGMHACAHTHACMYRHRHACTHACT